MDPMAQATPLAITPPYMHGPSKSIYWALCGLLAGKPAAADWGAFSDREWRALAQLARSEGVAPLVYARLQSSAGDGMALGWQAAPQAARQALSDAYYAAAAYNQLLYRELDKVLAAAQDFGVQLILLKGAVLAASLYRDNALRPMSDLDLLVPRQQLEQAIRAIEAAGYHKQKVTYHALFHGGLAGEIPLELHWNLIPLDESSPEVKVDWFQEHLIHRSIPGLQQPCFCLDPQAQLLTLASHLVVQHGARNPRLIWIYDIYLVLEKYQDQLDWAEISRIAAALGWQGALGAALQIVEHTLGAAWPDEARPYVQALLSNLTGNGRAGASRLLETDVRAWIQSAMGVLDWQVRLRMTLSLMFPSPGYLRWRYKPRARWLSAFFYPLRWWEMLREYALLRSRGGEFH